jgi:hypothetical protein
MIMKTKQVAAGSFIALAAALAAACSGGGGSAPAPSPKVVSSAPVSGVSPSANATLPPGTVGITLTIKIPANKGKSSLNRLRTKRTPAFIQSTTDGVIASVTPSSGPVLNTSGSCTISVCTILVPIPIAFSSTVVVQLTEGGAPIGQATTSFAANAFTEGTANSGGTLTFQPLIATIAVVPVTSSPPPFFAGQASSTFDAQVALFDPEGNDVGSETDGVLDMTGTPITQLTVTQTGIIGATFPIVFNVSATNPASDLLISSSLSADGSAQPNMTVSVTGGGTSLSTSPFSNTTGYSFTNHGLTVTPPGQYSAGPPFSIEYPSSYGLASDTFTVTEAIPADASGGLIGVTVNELGGLPNGSSNCAAITNLTSENVPYSGGASFSVNYNNPPFNGVCTIEVNDGTNPYQDITIAVNNPIIIIDSKGRRK